MGAKTKAPIMPQARHYVTSLELAVQPPYSVRLWPSNRAILRVTAGRINHNCRTNLLQSKRAPHRPPGPCRFCFHSGWADFTSLCFSWWCDFHRSLRLAGLRSVWDQRGIGSLWIALPVLLRSPLKACQLPFSHTCTLCCYWAKQLQAVVSQETNG